MIPLRPLAEHKAALAGGAIKCRELVQAGLGAIFDPAGEGKRAFIRVDAATALHTAEAFDRQFKVGHEYTPLQGLPISVKDLFDIAGETTRAGSQVLADSPVASADAPVIARLRSAGAVIVGRTNMTEFAYSGLGINPHYGTPRNPFDRIHGRIPGGSSSGAAVSVADGMVAAAIGSDTGGSVRIPAALCGLTGFKPTAHRVPLDGVLPLSPTLDSVGTIAPTVACCALLDSVLSGNRAAPLASLKLSAMRLGVLHGYVLDELDRHVATCFEAALSILSRAGTKLVDIEFEPLHEIAECGTSGGFAAAESYAWHRSLLAEHSSQYDPRVLSRILRGKEITASSYAELVRIRREVIIEAKEAFAEFDAILLPTTPRVAPLTSDLESDDRAYFDANAAMLRNPSVFNFLDGCSLSIPCHCPGEAPVGLMISGLHGHDAKILRIGRSVEDVLAKAGRAILGQ